MPKSPHVWRPFVRAGLSIALLVASLAAGHAWAPPSTPELWRPVVHFTPPQGFMNDPNGLVYLDGQFHLFYQHNPFGPKWGHMSWGHAVSRDLLTWRDLPVALREDEGWMMFSGSAVADTDDTSGLCNGSRTCLAAIYTMHRETRQAQGLAVSPDGGTTWTKFAGNPVLDLQLKDFRDPKVFWHAETRQWVMAVSIPDGHQVRLFGSKNLKSWTPLSTFGPAGAVAGVWECPTLMRVPVEGTSAWKWVLAVRVSEGAPAGGTGIQYFVGDFDGTRFAVDGAESAARWVDAGPDFYAAQDWNNMPSDPRRTVWVGWMSNWIYANEEPSGEGGPTTEPSGADWTRVLTQVAPRGPWRGAMTIPREVSVRRVEGAWRLVQTPVRELVAAREPSRLTVRPVDAGADQTRSRVDGSVTNVDVTVRLGTAAEAGLYIHASDTERTRIAVSRSAGGLVVDRHESGTSAGAKFPLAVTVPLHDVETARFRVIIDRSSIEIFADDGLSVVTMRVFPSQATNQVWKTFTDRGVADVSVVEHTIRVSAPQ
jgi:fructan beta-fructosidase